MEGAAMLIKTCLYCGRKFEAKRKTKKYCSDKCRVYANNAILELKKGGGSWDYPTPTTVTQDSICQMIVTLKGDAAFFDGAAETGPEKYRTLCRAIADGVMSTCRELGV